MRKNGVIREKRGKSNFVKCGNPERNALFGAKQPADAGGKPRQSQMVIGSDFQTLPREKTKLRFRCRDGLPSADAERRAAL